MKRAICLVLVCSAATARADLPYGQSIDAYRARCKRPDTSECMFLYGLVRADVLLALDDLVFSRDKRSVAAGIKALRVDDPTIQRAAMRVLRRFPRAPEVAPAVLPFLLGEHPVLRQVAADILDKSNGDLARLGRQYLETHPIPTTPDRSNTVWNVDELPDLAALGFAPYAGWKRYPVADGKGALGYSTPDAVASVVAFYEKKTGGKAVDAAGFEALKNAHPSTDTMRGNMSELQRLMTEYQKTHDPAILTKVQALAKGAQAGAMQASQAAAAGPVKLAPPPTGPPADTLRVVVAERSGDAPAKILYIYREAAIDHTVVVVVWNDTGP